MQVKLKTYLSLWFSPEVGLVNLLVLYSAVCLISHIGQRNDLSLASLAKETETGNFVVKVLSFSSSMNLFSLDLYRIHWDI